MFGVIGRMWQRGAMMVVVVRGNGDPQASDVIGLITKEHIADSVALSVRPYGSVDGKPQTRTLRLLDSEGDTDRGGGGWKGPIAFCSACI